MRPRPGARAGLLLALLLVVARQCTSQMESPLKGSGVPRLETTKVFVSAYVDRLLGVDADNYRWEAVIYFYISWRDPSAYATMLDRTIQTLSNSSYTCSKPCISAEAKSLCCDDIFVPAFVIKNAYGFPQDRLVVENLYVSADGPVMREVRVHGVYYQPMDFSKYPFDSFDLLLELRFLDITLLVDTTELWGAPHPGMQLVPSSGGSKLYTYGKGDDTNNWAIKDFGVETYSIDWGEWFSDNSDIESNPEDPTPLSPGSANQTGGQVDEYGRPLNVFSGVPDQLLAVVIRVERFWKPSLINAVMPVILVFSLGMFLFFTDESELVMRLEIVVALFLALTAVQFVLQGSLPTSSYVVPTQQLVLTTYIFLFLVSLESILVYHIVNRHKKQRQNEKRRSAYRRYCELRDQGKLKHGRNLPLTTSDMDPAQSAEQGGAADAAVAAAAAAAAMAARPASGAGEAAEERQQQPRSSSLGLFTSSRSKAPRAPPPLPSSVSSFQHLTTDEAYADYVGHLVDVVAAALLGVGYMVTAILIFALQHGYTDLFAE